MTQDVAEKFLNGDLEKPQDGYDGIDPGHKSLKNHATIKFQKEGKGGAFGPHKHTKENPDGLHEHPELL